jgi:phosphoglycolate phosphatase
LTPNHRRYDLAIFDLDGTLIDSKLDLAHSVNATRAHMGLEPLPHELIFTYVGNGAPMLIQRSLPDASEEECARALEFFIHYYHDHRLDYTVLYPGVKATLRELHGAGVELAVLTNKPVRISNAIVEGLGVADLFLEVLGGNSFDRKKPDPVGILHLLQRTGAAPARTLMVGDSNVDIETAVNAGVASCGVTYGFRPDTLASPRPTHLIERFDELRGVVFPARQDLA